MYKKNTEQLQASSTSDRDRKTCLRDDFYAKPEKYINIDLNIKDKLQEYQ